MKPNWPINLAMLVSGGQASSGCPSKITLSKVDPERAAVRMMTGSSSPACDAVASPRQRSRPPPFRGQVRRCPAGAQPDGISSSSREPLVVGGVMILQPRRGGAWSIRKQSGRLAGHSRGPVDEPGKASREAARRPARTARATAAAACLPGSRSALPGRQNAFSGRSIRSSEVASAISRSAASLGSTVSAKKRAAAILPW